MTTVTPLPDGESGAPLRPRPFQTPAPLSCAQQRFWFVEHWAAGESLHNIPVLMRIPGTLDLDALRRAIHGVMLRHEILRTRFVDTPAGPAQQCEPDPVVSLTSVDVSADPEPPRAAQAWLTPLIQRGFDLTALPLLRAHVVTVRPLEHLLVFVGHHMVIDAWSAAILRREIDALYRAGRDGVDVQLPPLSVQYADFAVWQRAWIGSRAYHDQLAYWTRQMADPPTLTLPTDRPRPSRPVFRGDVVPFAADAGLCARLRATASRHRATLPTILMASLHAVLARYAGQEDVTIGMPVANRPRTELEGLIGPFLNTLVIRSQPRPHRPFAELLMDVREAWLNALAHQDLPFERLVEAVQPQRDRTRSPLFDTLFSFEAGAEAPAGPMPSRLQLPTKVVQFDLTVRVHARGGQIAGGVEYRTDLFDRWRIEQIAQQFLATLHVVATAPELPLSAVWSISEASRLRRPVAPPAHGELELIPTAFVRQALSRPDAPAVSCENRQLTYRAVHQRVARTADELMRQGAGRGSVVAIALPRSENLVLALLSVLYSGAAFVSLDPAHPRTRLQALVADARPVCVLTTDEMAERLPPAVPRMLLNGDGSVACDRRAGDAVERVPSPAHVSDLDAAYLLYTSGSTGQPKGVVVEHGALARFASAIQKVLPFNERDRHLAITTPTFDIALLELLLPLAHGAEVIVATDTEALDPSLLSERAARAVATSIQTTPSRWDLLLNGGCVMPESVRILVGGEALSGRRALALTRDAEEVWNLYGPTEATIWATAYRLTGHEAAEIPAVSLGHPLPGYQAYVLDGRLSLVPAGVIGDLYLSGAALARGYARQPALTAQCFIADPFADNGTRMYRTGDRAWVHPDGHLEFAGRGDRQSKVHGVRVELGEIDAVLRTHRAVGEVHALVLDGEDADQLAAYVLLQDGSQTGDASEAVRRELERLLTTRLPPPAGRTRVVVLDRWPLTPAGKLDRTALPRPAARPTVAYRPPQHPHERILCDLFASLLGKPHVGLDDDFFDCGGHSLPAIRLMARVQECFGVQLEVGALFDHPTAGALAALVERTLITEIAGIGSGVTSGERGQHDGASQPLEPPS